MMLMLLSFHDANVAADAIVMPALPGKQRRTVTFEENCTHTPTSLVRTLFAFKVHRVHRCADAILALDLVDLLCVCRYRKRKEKKKKKKKREKSQ